MKKIFYYTAFCLAVAAFSSCSKVDNYAPPSSTLSGSTVDEGTGEGLQTEIGGGGTRVKLLEISYGPNPVPQYFQSKQDGTFNNTKLFAATYKVSVEGPFVPLVRTDNSGTVVSDSSQTITLKGSATVNFKVQPFLRVTWIGKPVLNADKTVTVQFKLARGTRDADYQQQITDVNLYVSNTQYDGNNNYDPRYSVTQTFSSQHQTDSLLSNTLTLTTKGGALPAQDVYFRIGARIDAGLRQYNYSTPMSVSGL